MPSVSIILPAYNEGEVIGSVLQSLLEAAQEGWEIIVVDDGSTDDTAARAGIDGVRVVRHPYNKGNGAAVKTGLRTAGGEVVCLMDADGRAASSAASATPSTTAWQPTCRTRRCSTLPPGSAPPGATK